MTDFDAYVDRSRYPTMEWSEAFQTEHYGRAGLLPMSVADMDLKAPPAVIQALRERAAHGIYGYEIRPESLYDALTSWYRERHGWEIAREQIEHGPSILNALAILIEQHSEPGDGVIIQPPVFFGFGTTIRANERRTVSNPLTLVEGRYQMDLAGLEEAASDPRNKILILCNPHNPVGRAWTEAELRAVAEICARHDVLVIADEIHGDLVLPPHRYTPFLSLPETDSQRAVACISPAKAFNVAGMVDAMAVLPDDEARQRFHSHCHRYQLDKVNVFASAATEAAYRHGGEWLDALLDYIQGNLALMRQFLAANPISVSLIEPEATFLAWLDLRGLGLSPRALIRFLADEAGLALSPGHWYGREGRGFARMTIGCPRGTVERALSQLAGAV